MTTPVAKLPPVPVKGKPEERRVPLEVLVSMHTHVIEEFSRFGNRPYETLSLSILAGCYITFAAILAAVFSDGVADKLGNGVAKPLSAMGFVIGFGLVIVTGSLLFTELNVSCPIYIFIHGRENLLRVVRVWVFSLLGNAAGAGIVAGLVVGADALAPSVRETLKKICVAKLSQQANGVGGWFSTFTSAILANWLVGMAAVLAGEGRTLADKFVGIMGPLVAFASIGFQHSIANMGFYFVALAHGGMPFSFGDAMWHNIVPAILGNIVGAGLFVAAMFYWAYGYAKPEVFVIAQEKPHRAPTTPGVVMKKFSATPRAAIGPGYLTPGRAGARTPGRSKAKSHTPITVEMPEGVVRTAEARSQQAEAERESESKPAAPTESTSTSSAAGSDTQV